MLAGEGIFVSNWAFCCRTGLFCVERVLQLMNRGPERHLNHTSKRRIKPTFSQEKSLLNYLTLMNKNTVGLNCVLGTAFCKSFGLINCGCGTMHGMAGIGMSFTWNLWYRKLIGWSVCVLRLQSDWNVVLCVGIWLVNWAYHISN